jgi:hypothetical protein
MKKPVRKTEKEILAIVAKRKTLKRRETKAIPTGSLDKLNETIIAFAKKVGVDPMEVRIGGGGYYNYGPTLVAERIETEDEKFKRIKADEDQKYRAAKWQYDHWKREQEYAQEQAAANLNAAVRNANKNQVTIKCDCSCKCK